MLTTPFVPSVECTADNSMPPGLRFSEKLRWLHPDAERNEDGIAPAPMRDHHYVPVVCPHCHSIVNVICEQVTPLARSVAATKPLKPSGLDQLAGVLVRNGVDAHISLRSLGKGVVDITVRLESFDKRQHTTVVCGRPEFSSESVEQITTKAICAALRAAKGQWGWE
jgi:hypothetical protein